MAQHKQLEWRFVRSCPAHVPAQLSVFTNNKPDLLLQYERYECFESERKLSVY